MRIDIVGSYLELNEFLEPRGHELIPEGEYLKVMDKSAGKAVCVADTIVEVSDWVEAKFGKRILVEV